MDLDETSTVEGCADELETEDNEVAEENDWANAVKYGADTSGESTDDEGEIKSLSLKMAPGTA